MDEGQEFIDYYNVLQVNPNCDAKILESAYRYLAKMYHPDHAETANVEKFSQVTEAYKVLRDPAKRATYDRAYFLGTDRPLNSFPLENDLESDEETALSDAELHERILLTLYKRRREHAYDAGVVGWFIQQMLQCSDDNFEFHVWYLKSKGLLEITEQGTLAITIKGVDHVISMSRSHASEKLLIGQSASSSDPA
jgi:curved DNA-binding protein